MKFDHCYQKIQNSQDYFALADRGFTLAEGMTEHPGRQLCRFIKFKRKNSSKIGTYQYLEFVELADLEVLKTTYPAGTSKEVMLEPGFSLLSPGNLKSFYDSNLNSFSEFGPKFSHTNYNWKDDSNSHLPGWNFLEFNKPLIPGIHIWCTEYEPRPDYENSPPVAFHANTVNEFQGFIWNVTVDNAQSFSRLANSKVVDDQIELEDGTKVFLNRSLEVFGRKDTPFSAVVLDCANWESFCKYAKPDKIIEWNGREAGLIILGAIGWNILVVQK